MSKVSIARLSDDGVFEATDTFEELGDCHVDFDELVGGKKREAALRLQLTRDKPAKVAVIGPSGSGKSSLIAATFAELPEHLPLPIAIGQADEEILASQTKFGQFILREVLRQSEGKFALQGKIKRREKKRIRNASVDAALRTGAGFSGGVSIPVPAFLHGAPALAKIAANLNSAAKTSVELANPSTSIDGLTKLMSVFDKKGMPTPVLIIDDADKWASSTDPSAVDARAHFLFTSALQPLLAAQFHLVVAVQNHWRGLNAYDNLHKRLTATIEIPEFAPDATSALREIITWRAVDPDDGDLNALDQILDTDAITRLEAEYDHSGRSIRHVLRVLDRAIKNAADETPVPDHLDRVHIRRAAQELAQ